MKVKNPERQIEVILEGFDFKEVHKAMKALNWKWYTSDDIPTISDMKDTAKSLLKKVSSKDDVTYISTGGFKASVDKWGHLGLAFEVSSGYYTESAEGDYFGF